MMGKRNHKAAQKRTVSPRCDYGRTGLGARLIRAICPWTIAEYPGYLRFLADTCGVGVGSARKWIYGHREIPARHARRLSLLCRERASALVGLADEFDAVAEARERRGRAGLNRRDRGG